MTSRERVVAALRHEEPDRVPLDIGGTESSGLTGIACNSLRAHLGLPQGKTQIFDVYQQIAKLEPDLRDALGIDTVPLLLEPLAWKPFALPDGSPCEIPETWRPEPDEQGDLVVRNDAGTVVARLPQGGFYFEPVHAPLAAVEEPAELDEHAAAIESFDWPSFADESLDHVAARAERLFRDTDLAIVGNLQLHLLAAGQLLRGYEQFMIDLLVNQPLAHALLERLVDAYTRRADRYLDRVGHLIQVVLLNDDLGTQTGPMLSPTCYREMIFPHQKRLFAHIKAKRPELFLLFHSCGSVRRFIPSLIELGVDALNPVQVSAAEMHTAELKSEFGAQITFWGGGCDTQHVLNRGTPRDVANEVRRRIHDLAPGGGFVFTQVHNIQPDVPPANIVAMVEALRKHGASR